MSGSSAVIDSPSPTVVKDVPVPMAGVCLATFQDALRLARVTYCEGSDGMTSTAAVFERKMKRGDGIDIRDCKQLEAAFAKVARMALAARRKVRSARQNTLPR